jgi:outer membrane protein assembly factor BamB
MISRRRGFSPLPTGLIVICLLSGSAVAGNWPQWRGLGFDGVSEETGLPVEWSATKNIAWRLPLPGPAGATPVVWDDHIFLTSVNGQDLVLIAADRKGTQLWSKAISTGNRNIRGDEGNFASPSPCTDGEHVWAMMGTGVLAGYNFDGKEIWKVDLPERYGRIDIQFGLASTPILDGDRLYLQLIRSGGSLVIALDKRTGREIWKQNRPTDARDESEQSYASPIIYRDGQREMLLSHGGDFIVAHRLTDGQEIWRCGGLNPKGRYNNTLRFIASPVAAADLIVVPSAKNGPVLGLRPDGQGDVTNVAAVHWWTHPQNTPDVPSPLIQGGLVYLCRENGNLIVLDAKTGEEYYEHRTHSDRYRASPLYADGKIYLTSRDGTITVVKAGKEFEVLATNTMGENITASPVIANGTLYLRTFDALYAIRGAH